ncbi:MAG: hypothetical protein QM831_38830 [Kofleriaceae bacterium]
MPRLYLVTLPLFAACGSGGGFPDARPIDAAPPKGTFTLSWAVTDPGGTAIPCSQIGAQSVTVLTHNLAEDGGETQVFVCSQLSGESEAIAPGTYEMNFELDAQGSVQLATAPTQHNVVVPEGGQVALDPISFAVDDNGSLDLLLSSGRATNCGAAPTGAGITSMQISLTHNSDLTCAPITLHVGAGATSGTGAFDYNFNSCDTPIYTEKCIENDQHITASTLAGDYTIKVKGVQSVTVGMPDVGPVCWTNGDSLTIPPLSGTLTRTLNLGFQMMTAGCM